MARIDHKFGRILIICGMLLFAHDPICKNNAVLADHCSGIPGFPRTHDVPPNILRAD